MEITITKDDKSLALGFVEESLELLNDIEERILEMEANYDIETVNDIFRAVHTIKGTSSFLSLTPIKNLSHNLEFLLDDLRKGKRELTQEIVDVLLKGSDILRSLILEVKNSVESSEEDVILNLEIDESIIEEIKEVREKEGGTSEKSEQVKVEKAEDKIIKTEENLDTTNLKNAEIPSDMFVQYKDEAKEHLDNIENHLLTLENNPDNQDSINEVFRSLHSLKGNSGLLLSLIEQESYEAKLLSFIKDVAHGGESLLQRVRDGKLKLSSEIISLLFRALDYMNLIFDRIIQRENRESVPLPDNLIRELSKKEFKEEKETKEEQKSSGYDPVAEAMDQFLDVSEKLLNEWKNKQEYTKKDIDTFKRIIKLLETSTMDIDDEELKKSIQTVKETIEFLEKGKFNLKDGIATGILEDKIAFFKKFKEENLGREFKESGVKKIGEILVEKGKIDEKDLKEALEEQKKQIERAEKKEREFKMPLSSTQIESIRVRMDKLDKLMNDIGELIISKNSFFHIYTKLVQANVPDIAKEFKEKMIMKIGRLAEDLQNTIVQIRMIPVKTVFQKFPRMVRDLALKNGKKIRLVMEGEDTELDKTVIEKISDPLVHIVRNSCDHGIETPEERRKNNKEETGTILLKAEKKGNNVIIMIIDDGRGMDIEKIKRKAVEKGLISEEEAEKLSKREAINLIFLPGFSTADKVTEVSGRGVGMDVVKTNITKLKGSIEIETEKGVGTTIIIKLPLTLAITKGLSFRLGTEYYIVPLENVEEIIKIKEDDIRFFKDRRIVNIRGEVIELLDLKKNYDIAEENIKSSLNEDNELNIIILKNMGIKFGLIVDELEEELDMVVKPLPPYLSSIPGIGGSTILGDGRVAIVLEPSEMISLLNS